MGDKDFQVPMEPPSQRLSNSDFRKLMMTPRAGSGAVPATPSLGGSTPGGGAMSGGKTPSMTPRRVDKAKAEERRKKKTYYAKLKKDEDDKMAELAAKYRDRAKERRDGTEGSVPTEDTNNAYRAVAPNAPGAHDAAERRKQMIHESKYLGGDMEHTHLVKGLDFALLQKVRAEIEAVETAKVDEEEEEVTIKEVSKKAEEAKAEKKVEEKPEEDKPITECRTTMGKNIVRLMFNPEGPKSNELFMAGRMAYVMDLEEDGETDIPTTSIRSKKDVVNSEQKATLSTNDIVINKLTQILSYLRAGNRTKRKKKDKIEDLLHVEEEVIKNNVVKGKDADVPIYDDIGDYRPSKKDDRRDDRKRDKYRDNDYRERERDDYRDRRDRDDRKRDRYRDDRDKYRDERDTRDRYDRDDRRQEKKQSYFDKPDEQEEKQQRGFSNEDKQMIKALMKREETKDKDKADKKLAGMMEASANDGYAECYPGLAEMDDAVIDSDDEADYSKMDMGNKKGPVGRWDFDTAEEYADYMGKKEAMPKAAFQYGMKMSDGRKTRGKVGTKKNEKAALDREWNQILGVINKRKGGDGGGGSKKAKYDDE